MKTVFIVFASMTNYSNSKLQIALATNGFGLGEGWDFEKQMFNLKTKFHMKNESSINHCTPCDAKLLVSRLLQSDDNILAEAIQSARKVDTEVGLLPSNNDIKMFCLGAKWSRDTLIAEIQRRQQMIISEPDGIVRETMINDLLVGLQ